MQAQNISLIQHVLLLSNCPIIVLSPCTVTLQGSICFSNKQIVHILISNGLWNCSINSQNWDNNLVYIIACTKCFIIVEWGVELWKMWQWNFWTLAGAELWQTFVKTAPPYTHTQTRTHTHLVFSDATCNQLSIYSFRMHVILKEIRMWACCPLKPSYPWTNFLP